MKREKGPGQRVDESCPRSRPDGTKRRQMMIDEQVQQATEDGLVFIVLLCTLLPSHSNPSIRTRPSHTHTDDSAGTIQQLHTTTTHHTIPVRRKYRLHGGTSSVYRAGSRHGTGTIFLSFEDYAFRQETCFEANTRSQHTFAHFTTHFQRIARKRSCPYPSYLCASNV